MRSSSRKDASHTFEAASFPPSIAFTCSALHLHQHHGAATAIARCQSGMILTMLMVVLVVGAMQHRDDGDDQG
jgi:hypothetical protein